MYYLDDTQRRVLWPVGVRVSSSRVVVTWLPKLELARGRKSSRSLVSQNRLALAATFVDEAKAFSIPRLMVVLHVPASPLLGAVAAASAHGLTDLQRPPHELVPYGVVMLPAIMPSFPSEAVTAMFLACSWQHFARDIGHVRSFWLHMAFVVLSQPAPELAWLMFSIYYCALHVPRHLTHHCDVRPALRVGMLMAAMVMAGVVIALVIQGAPTLYVTDWMQLGVVAHVLVDELTTRSASAPSTPSSPSSPSARLSHELS